MVCIFHFHNLLANCRSSSVGLKSQKMWRACCYIFANMDNWKEHSTISERRKFQ